MKWRDRAVDYARRAGAAQNANDVDTIFLASVLRQDLAAVSEGRRRAPGRRGGAVGPPRGGCGPRTAGRRPEKWFIIRNLSLIHI